MSSILFLAGAPLMENADPSPFSVSISLMSPVFELPGDIARQDNEKGDIRCRREPGCAGKHAERRARKEPSQVGTRLKTAHSTPRCGTPAADDAVPVSGSLSRSLSLSLSLSRSFSLSFPGDENDAELLKIGAGFRSLGLMRAKMTTSTKLRRGQAPAGRRSI